MNKILIALAAAGVLASGAAAAGTRDISSAGFGHVQYQQNQHSEDRAAQINEREARINARIQRGIQDGRLTEREAHRLMRELRDVTAKERTFKSDGRLNGREASELNSDLDRLAEHLRRQVHDNDRY